MSTEKLYYSDSHISEFEATVTSCVPDGEKYLITLDRTAFFPEGGGQPSDKGYIGPCRISHVYEDNNSVIHVSDKPAESEKYFCRVDFDRRLDFMKKHTSEHIISGIIHNKYGYDNVGFHLSENETTLDTSGKLTPEDIAFIELEANRIVQKNVSVKAYFPSENELAELEYRSKKEIEGDVRIVEIEGVDKCACCAPHVSQTGEIGLVKILKYYSWKGGMRLHITAGIEAYEDYRKKFDMQTRIANAHSSAPELLEDIIAKYKSEISGLKEKLKASESLLIDLYAEKGISSPGENAYFIIETISPEAAVKLAESAAEKKNVCAVFSGKENEYNFVICSKKASAKEFADVMKEKINIRGGGNDSMVRGRASASRKEIEGFFEK